MSIASFAESTRLGTVQTITVVTASAGATNAFGSQTYMIRVAANTPCHFRVGDGTQTAVTTDSFLPVNWIEYIRVSPGQKIAAIRALTNGLVTATDGTMTVTELSA